MPDILLSGCTPDPLGSYLKAVGVLRLVATQADPGARGRWAADAFALDSALDQEGLVRFFLDAYRPSPIVAPWNSNSGFWGRKAASQTLARLEASSNPRLALYRQVIQVARQVVAEMGLGRAPKDEEKARLLRRLRARLPDEAIAWLDAAAVLVDGDPRYAPLLGSGGHDGRLDFTIAFMQHLERVLSLGGDTGDAQGQQERRGDGYDPGQSRAWLEDALFATGAPLLVEATPGQYHPGAVGGPTATRGMEGHSLANPWDFVLMMEGTLAFASAVARRLGVADGGRASFPFTVDAVPVGTGTIAEGEVADARGEIWVPLWEQPATYTAVAYLVAEGRAQAGRRQATNSLDFARAAASLGVDRGVGAFYRYAFLRRNGKAYLAIPLGRIRVQARPHMHLIDELEPWLDRWRLFCEASETPERYRRAARAMEAAIFAYCQDGGPAALQRVLAATGRAEQALAAGPKEENRPAPLQGLSLDWLAACADGNHEFHLAAAVASLYDPVLGPLRPYLEPVVQKDGRWRWTPAGTGSAMWGGQDLDRNLAAVLDRRLLDAARLPGAGHPCAALAAAPWEAVHRFLEGEVDATRIADLVWGLACLRWPAALDGVEGAPGAARPDPAARQPGYGGAPPALLSRAYALLRLAFWPGRLHLGPGPGVRVPPDRAIVALLVAGRVDDALQAAGQRLWAAGLAPLGWRKGYDQLPRYAPPPGGGLRLAASLLVPVPSAWPLARMVLYIPEESSG